MDSTDDLDGEISDLGGDELKESLGLQYEQEVSWLQVKEAQAQVTAFSLKKSSSFDT